MRTINITSSRTQTASSAGNGIHEQTVAELAARGGLEAKDLTSRGRHVSNMARDWLSDLERRSVYLPV